MKVLIFNGSPRQTGNTADAVNLLNTTITDQIQGAEVEVIDTNSLNLKACQGCEGCKKTDGKCVCQDDTNAMVEKVIDADVLLFATPVYFWGVTAQLKLAIDKLYCLGGYKGLIKKKQVGILSIGGASVGATQYGLISKQFECIFNYFDWPIIFDEAFCAWQVGDLKNNPVAVDKISSLWETIHAVGFK